MTSVDQLGIKTVINKEEFSSNVLVKDCPVVGRSLVANRPLVPGDVVLVEEPLIKYDLKPTCRSTKSPYYSKKLWNMLNSMVHDEEDDKFQQQHQEIEEKEDNDHYDDGDTDSYNYSSDEEDDDEEEEEINPDSDFCPGVPAAIIAYLDIHPPKKHFTNVKNRNVYKRDDFDFFYYPNSDIEPAWLDHKTIKLIHTVTQKVADTIPLYSHVDPYDLRSFVLKIYSNAHTVALPRNRTMPTHSAKKARREAYKAKFGDNVTYWGEDAVDPPSTPTIALLRWGSKFAHSCSPNMFLRFEPDRNAMVFTVTRPLKEGEVLSFSYLPEDDSTVGGLVLGNVFDRRAKLQKFKFFECSCERCVDWDWSRGVTCNACHQPTSFRDDQGVWTCFSCQAQNKDNEASYIGEREENVQQMIMGFVARVHGQRRMNESMMRMLEPYLLDLLNPAPEKNEVAVPKNHWTHGVIHSLLASYHLALFPQSFGKGLAAQLGLTVQGLEEALVYIEFLNNTICTHPKSTNTSNITSHGNLMAAFFAGWRTLTLVIDLVIDSTENKYANVVYERDFDDDDSDDESVSDNEKTEKKQTVQTTTTTNVEESNINTNTEPVLLPLNQDWVAPLTKISNIINEEWIPLVEQVFKFHQSVVVQDMISQIKSFVDRIEKTIPSAYTTTTTT
jgi:ribosomal protein L37AE/L43A